MTFAARRPIASTVSTLGVALVSLLVVVLAAPAGAAEAPPQAAAARAAVPASTAGTTAPLQRVEIVGRRAPAVQRIVIVGQRLRSERLAASGVAVKPL